LRAEARRARLPGMEDNPMVIVGVMAGVLLVSLIVALVVIRRMLYVVAPNEILVLSGRPNRLADGRVVGYRVVSGGRALRIPIIERADVIDASGLSVAFAIRNAYSADGVPLKLSGWARITPYREFPGVANFVERFLGRSREDVGNVARETLEGQLRGVVAKLRAAELTTDRERFTHAVVEEAEHDLSKLGLVLDSLKLEDVAAPPPPARVPD
jgi:flotillin